MSAPSLPLARVAAVAARVRVVRSSRAAPTQSGPNRAAAQPRQRTPSQAVAAAAPRLVRAQTAWSTGGAGGAGGPGARGVGGARPAGGPGGNMGAGSGPGDKAGGQAGRGQPAGSAGDFVEGVLHGRQPGGGLDPGAPQYAVGLGGGAWAGGQNQ